jgi:hypothetical protein
MSSQEEKLDPYSTQMRTGASRVFSFFCICSLFLLVAITVLSAITLGYVVAIHDRQQDDSTLTQITTRKSLYIGSSDNSENARHDIIISGGGGGVDASVPQPKTTTVTKSDFERLFEGTILESYLCKKIVKQAASCSHNSGEANNNCLCQYVKMQCEDIDQFCDPIEQQLFDDNIENQQLDATCDRLLRSCAVS